LAALAFAVAALSLMAARGGAPTHHNGRALLAVWLAVAVAAGAGLFTAAHAHTRRGRFAVGAALAALPLGAFVLRPWYAPPDAMSARAPEVAIGRLARAAV